MTIDIEAIRVDDTRWMIEVVIDGIAMKRHGPLPDADAAEIAAAKMRKIGRALTNPSGE